MVVLWSSDSDLANTRKGFRPGDLQRMYLNRDAIILLSMIEDGLHRGSTNTNEGRAGITELHDTYGGSIQL